MKTITYTLDRIYNDIFDEKHYCSIRSEHCDAYNEDDFDSTDYIRIWSYWRKQFGKTAQV